MNSTIDTVLSDMGLTLDSKFIPFSQSRNKDKKYPSLNWIVTLKKNGREVLTTDYWAGCGHCPSYNQGMNYDTLQLVKAECETGYPSKHLYALGTTSQDKKKPIKPDLKDVVYSLVMDSDAIDYEFVDWCMNYGYEEDSRKAERIYAQCQELGLKLLRALGPDGLTALRELYQDY